MIKQEILDQMLEKIVTLSNDYLDYCVEEERYNKDLAEAIAIVLSVAYERIDKVGKQFN